MFSTNAISNISWSFAKRTYAGIDFFPANCDALKRLSPDINSYSPESFLRTVMGCITPNVEIDEINSSKDFLSKLVRGCQGLAVIFSNSTSRILPTNFLAPSSCAVFTVGSSFNKADNPRPKRLFLFGFAILLNCIVVVN